jgi:hypothetical protein
LLCSQDFQCFSAAGAVVRQINSSLDFGSLFIYYLLRIP